LKIQALHHLAQHSTSYTGFRGGKNKKEPQKIFRVPQKNLNKKRVPRAKKFGNL
jgi:hypothetical protein